jgi:predicted ATPase/transcriptional regulator with XRE-family HTH domain
VLQKVLQFFQGEESRVQTFGEWLRDQRTARKLTREEFASRVGCSVAMLRKIEDGERRPSVQIAELIANLLDISSDDRGTFIKVARGELGTARLSPLSKTSLQPGISLTQTASRVNLPAIPTPLIGRQDELEELSKLLKDPQCRLLTLVGPGGMGKTRLSIESAFQSQSDFADGVYFVALAPVTSSRLVVPVIAEAVGFAFHSDSSIDPRSQLFYFLREKQALLVIDNLEHLLHDSEIIELFAELIAQATRVTLLVTSRESLGLQGEWVFEVRGLPMPERAEMGGTAVELFLQRARRAHVGFNATTEDIPAIIQICKLVDGMPLGIELAAAWVRTLSCEEIAHELKRSLDFLSVSAKDLPARHRSMRAVFDHSWKLLSEEEQGILLRLAVFQGGFSRDAAQQAAKATLPTLSALVTKSLVRRNGTGRYDLHELVRQYALDRLADQPKIQRETQSRHGRYFMDFLSRRDMSLRSSTQGEALAELLAEIDNIRGAWEWALAHKEFAAIERSLGAYSTFFDTLGWSQEALDTLGRVQASLQLKSRLSRTEQVALAHTFTSRSLFAFRAGQNEEARLMLERCLEMLNSLNEPHILVEALTFLGITKVLTGDLAGALKLFHDGLHVAREINDQWYEALCLTEVVGVRMWMGELNGIHEQFESAVEAWRKTGDMRFTAFGLNSLGLGAVTIGKYGEARAALEESISINTSIGDRWGLSNAYLVLGMAEGAQGQHTQALDAFHQSLQIFTELGARWEMARVLSEMARSTFALGDDSEAENLWYESLRLSLETQGTPTTMDAIVGIANVQAACGENQNALRLLLFSISHPAIIPKTKVQAEQLVLSLKEKLTAGEIESAQAFAENTSLEILVNEWLRRIGKGTIPKFPT